MKPLDLQRKSTISGEGVRSKAWGARDWVGRFADREEAAAGYANLLGTYGAKWDGWPYINAAIAERWSLSGLNHIKAKAWK